MKNQRKTRILNASLIAEAMRGKLGKFSPPVIMQIIERCGVEVGAKSARFHLNKMAENGVIDIESTDTSRVLFVFEAGFYKRFDAYNKKRMTSAQKRKSIVNQAARDKKARDGKVSDRKVKFNPPPKLKRIRRLMGQTGTTELMKALV